MMNNFMNNPMMDAFRKPLENSMNMWGQNIDMSKIFNPSQWIDISNKMMENVPWLKALHHHNHEDHIEHHAKIMDIFADLSHLSLENAQAMMHRHTEIIQKYSNDLYKFMQAIASSKDPATTIATQEEFMHASFEAMSNDLKELAEMYSKSNLETFETATKKVAKHIHKNKHCASACSEEETSKSSHSKKKR